MMKINKKIKKMMENEYLNVEVTQVSSIEDMKKIKNEFEDENPGSFTEQALSYMSEGILITEYNDIYDKYDGHVVWVYHLEKVSEDEILAFCKESL